MQGHGVGKTTLALQIATKIASQKRKVLFISLEMSAEQVIQKLLIQKTQISGYTIRAGLLEDKHWSLLGKACGEIQDLDMVINDRAYTMTSIEEAIRRQYNKGALDFVVIDYLQLIKNTNKYGSREQEVADISRTLKVLSLELKIPILALCQLNRASLMNKGKEPTLADLRESGSLEQDADNVFFLFNSQDDQEGNIIDVTCKIAKQRAGEIGKVYLKFNKLKQQFFGVEI